MIPDTDTLTIADARAHLDARDFSAVELTDAYLRAIAERDGDIHAYLEVFDDAREHAARADERLARGEAGALVGIPLALKDNILVEGNIASAGSKILENYRATYDATATEKLREAGAVFLGRTNCDEFAMGSSTENSAFGPTKNPHDPTRVAGGTSGGSVAAVAAGMATGALGSDTGGSIRSPSAFCGMVGLKPTYGAVSRHGLIAAASSLEGIATTGKTVSDAEILFNVIRGKDPLDSTTVDASDYPTRDRDTDIIGVPRTFLESSGLDERTMKNFADSVEKLSTLGYTMKDIELPNIGYSVPTYYIIIFAEESTNLARFDGVKYGLHIDGEDLLGDYLATRGTGFGPESRRRLILGAHVLSAGYHDAYYNKANAVRRLIADDFSEAFKQVSTVILPTMPGPAFKIGEKANDPVQMYLEDIFTVSANLTGLPAMSVPSGFVEEEGKKLPLGIQFYAPHLREDRLFAIGKTFLGEV